jgi:transcriptional regulator with XRE-family HTH domain
MRTTSIGKRIAAAREAMKLSQEELAQKSGVHRTTIARIEAGRFSPRLDTLELLSAVLGDLMTRKNFAEDVVQT